MTNATVPPIVGCVHNDPATHKREFCQMTKAQLYEIAQENGVKDAKPTMRKPELIELLEGAGL